MLPIESFSQYKYYVQKTKKLPNLITNCYLLPNQIKQMIQANRLFVMEKENMILLLEKEDHFFRIYYYLSLSAKYEKLVFDCPAVIEFVFQHEISENQYKEIAILHTLGFTLGRESARMSVGADYNFPIAKIGCCNVSRAVSSDADNVLCIIKKYFNPLYAYVPNKDQLLKAIQKESIFIIRQNDEIAALLFAETNQKNVEIRHLVVIERYRSYGFAKQLLQEYHAKYKDMVRLFFHWVDLHNTSALQLYKKFGYSFDGRRANEYVMLNKQTDFC